MCKCRFSPIPGDNSEVSRRDAWHYLRVCSHCEKAWWGIHCKHDGVQTPCPHCTLTTVPVIDTDFDLLVATEDVVKEYFKMGRDERRLNKFMEKLRESFYVERDSCG
jgi:hypothetical protein